MTIRKKYKAAIKKKNKNAPPVGEILNELHKDMPNLLREMFSEEYSKKLIRLMQKYT